MATHMVKLMYEGTPAKASPTAEAGLTSGGAQIFEIIGVPANLTTDDVLAVFAKAPKPIKHKDYEVKWSDLAG